MDDAGVVFGQGAVLPDEVMGGAADMGVVDGGANDGVVIGVVIVDIAGGGARPCAPSSVEPSGMPMRLAPEPEPIPGMPDVEALDVVEGSTLEVAQPLDAAPVVPPPSNIDDVALEEEPADALAPTPWPIVGSATAEQGAGVGLMPGDGSSMAPRGIPVCWTLELGPMPSGVVMPSGEEEPPEVWARTVPQTRREVATKASTSLIVMVHPQLVVIAPDLESI
ncbi:hypothetical protein SAMN02745126_02137 [Enhydrobacter aerosaccus]|uniref:Uncharacterized protein n=1 Tax=Enhydrobacter aerosaccus TaxID=225324 RepID=A0A1T4N7U1_9HYPH|nr:hypothetical protein [Enhydrobacter aerosaccus]SJZ74898.1 hypothetical protein SAMN02745126_02137 [Enhydrobacter aerosaccus]